MTSKPMVTKTDTNTPMMIPAQSSVLDTSDDDLPSVVAEIPSIVTNAVSTRLKSRVEPNLHKYLNLSCSQLNASITISASDGAFSVPYQQVPHCDFKLKVYSALLQFPSSSNRIVAY
jgi:hypothetical protein